MGGWLENWRVIPISAFNYVIVEVVAEIGNKSLLPDIAHKGVCNCNYHLNFQMNKKLIS